MFFLHMIPLLVVVVAASGGIVAIVMGCLLIRPHWDPRSQATTIAVSAIPGLFIVVVGGVLIGLALQYGSEFHRLISVHEGIPGQSAKTSACTTVDAHYGLIIDAGSTGSRIYIFCWKRAGANGIPWVKAAPELGGESPWSKSNKDLRDKAALSSYEKAPEDARKSLEPLIEYALAKIGNDPQTLARTSLYLMATAGMRQLSESDPEKSEQILQNVRQYLKRIPFNDVYIQVISGQQEGLFGWIAVNYLNGFLKDKNPLPAIGTTIGAIELGGASTQITYVPPDFSRHDGIPLQWGETTYQIYSQSLNLGQKRAIDQLDTTHKSTACYPKGYPVSDSSKGEGNYDTCRVAIRDMLREMCTGPEAARTCTLKFCEEVKECSSVKKQPPVSGVAFLAWSNYSYTQDFFKLGQFYSFEKLKSEGKQYCSKDWNEIQKEYSSMVGEEHLKGYCFSSAYIPTLLHEGYGFSGETQQITTANFLQGNEISWTLGAMVYIAMQ